MWKETCDLFTFVPSCSKWHDRHTFLLATTLIKTLSPRFIHSLHMMAPHEPLQTSMISLSIANSPNNNIMASHQEEAVDEVGFGFFINSRTLASLVSLLSRQSCLHSQELSLFIHSFIHARRHKHKWI
jgi:hypothetical protein